MTIASLVFNQVAIMLVLMALGYYAFRKQFLSLQGSKDLSLILMYVVSPTIQIKSFMIESSPEKTQMLFNSIWVGLIAFLIALVIAHLTSRKNPLFNFGIGFSNAGFIGIPLIYNTLGPDAVFYMLAYLTMSIIGMWTYGIFVMTQRKEDISLKKIVRNPVLIFLVIGLVLYFTQWKLPTFAIDVINFIAPLNTPLAMFVIGALIAEIPFKSIFTDKAIYKATFTRLILVPVVTGIVFFFLPGTSTQAMLMKTAILIVSAAPSAANTAILAHLFGFDASQGVKMVCLSTLLSILTIPLVVFIFERFVG